MICIRKFDCDWFNYIFLVRNVRKTITIEIKTNLICVNLNVLPLFSCVNLILWCFLIFY